jgi:hypothetical protein
MVLDWEGKSMELRSLRAVIPALNSGALTRSAEALVARLARKPAYRSPRALKFIFKDLYEYFCLF